MSTPAIVALLVVLVLLIAAAGLSLTRRSRRQQSDSYQARQVPVVEDSVEYPEPWEQSRSAPRYAQPPVSRRVVDEQQPMIRRPSGSAGYTRSYRDYEDDVPTPPVLPLPDFAAQGYLSDGSPGPVNDTTPEPARCDPIAQAETAPSFAERSDWGAPSWSSSETSSSSSSDSGASSGSDSSSSGSSDSGSSGSSSCD